MAQTYLPYWIEPDASGNPSKVWVKVPSIPANGSTVIYVWKDAGHVPDGSAVFEFFDDFSGSSLDTSKWDVATNGGTYSVANSEVLLNPVDNASNAVALVSKQTFTNNIIIEEKLRTNTDTYWDVALSTTPTISTTYWHWRDAGYVLITQTLNTEKRLGLVKRHDTSNTGASELCYSDWECGSYVGSYTVGADTFVRWIVPSTGEMVATWSYYGDGTQIGHVSATDTEYINAAKYLVLWQGEYTNGWGGESWIDWVRVRKYAPLEPTVTVTDKGGYYEITIDNPNATDLTDFQISFSAADVGVTSTSESLAISDSPPYVWAMGWHLYRDITVTNNGAADVTDPVIVIELDANNFDFSRARSDGKDILITKDDDVTVLPYHIAVWDVSIPKGVVVTRLLGITIPAGQSVKIHLWYNNPSATQTQEDPASVYDFWDDFDGTALDTNKWTVTNNGGSITVANSKVTIDTTSSTTATSVKITPNITLTSPVVAVASVSDVLIDTSDYMLAHAYVFGATSDPFITEVSQTFVYTPLMYLATNWDAGLFVYWEQNGTGQFREYFSLNSGDVFYGEDTNGKVTGFNAQSPYFYVYLIEISGGGTYGQAKYSLDWVGFAEVDPEVTYTVGAEGSAIFDHWSYRLPITVSNSNGTELTDFQVKVVVDTQTPIGAGKMNSDGSDIRFTTSDGKLVIPHWVETDINSPTTTIWVKVPSIPANGTTTIYMNYGQSSAKDMSNGDAVFEFFDDFDGTSLDTSKWTIDCTAGTYSVTVSNSILELNANAGSVRISSTVSYDYPIIVESFVADMSTYDAKNYTRNRYITSIPGSDSGVFDWSPDPQIQLYWDGYTGIPANLDTFQISQEIFIPGNLLRWIRPEWDVQKSITLTSTRLHYSVGDCGYTHAYGHMKFDWIRVRKYASTEPITTNGAEEPIVTATTYEIANSGAAYVVFRTVLDGSGLSRILRSVQLTRDGNARILRTIQQAINSVARVLKTSETQNTGNAYVLYGHVIENSGTARILRVKEDYRNSKARVLIQYTNGITGTARVVLRSIISNASKAVTIFVRQIQNAANAALILRKILSNTGSARITKTQEMQTTLSAMVKFLHYSQNSGTARVLIPKYTSNEGHAWIFMWQYGDIEGETKSTGAEGQNVTHFLKGKKVV